MSQRTISVTIPDAPAGAEVFAPTGIETPHNTVERFTLTGGRVVELAAARGLNLTSALISAEGGPLTITYTLGAPHGAAYPAEAFRPHATPWTSAADALATHAKSVVASAQTEREAVQRLVDEAFARFVYAHPDHRFKEGHTSVPLIACGGVEGSCVDINTYLIAMLRAAGLSAGYFVGPFFPAEKNGYAADMHCWVVTIADGVVEEWDIAHHLKLGAETVRPALDPKPGRRVALGHSMGHTYSLTSGDITAKLVNDPMWLDAGALKPISGLIIRDDERADSAERSAA